MTLPASGALAISQIRTELSASGQLNLGATSVRTLAGIASGQLSISNLYGKAGAPVFVSGPNMVASHTDTPGHCGTKTDALCVGGITGAKNVDIFNGTAWVSGTAYPIAAVGVRSVGSPTAALSMGGSISNTRQTASYSFDGTAWAATGGLVGNRAWHAAGGTVSDALVACGASNATNTLQTFETFNGSAWSARGNALTACQLTDGFA